MRSFYRAENLTWLFPTYKTPYIEEIDRIFKNKLPGSKSLLYEINLSGIGIADEQQEKIFIRFSKIDFNENEDKGARKLLSFGAGFKYNTVDVDLSYLISASKVRSPLENTLRFSLTFNFGDKYEYF